MTGPSAPVEGRRIAIDDDTRVLVLTGAGVSAESGIATFRGAGGMWRSRDAMSLATPEAFARDPKLVWEFYAERRAQAGTCAPNAGHHALVALEKRLGDRFLLATQNVDGLHRRAGSERVRELHGRLFATRCSGCTREAFDDDAVYTVIPVCDRCGGKLRPHIVWFGESLDPSHLEEVETFVHSRATKRLVFIAVGTSGAVYPAAGFVELARGGGAETWLVNADPADNGHRFQHFVQGASGVVLAGLIGG